MDTELAKLAAKVGFSAFVLISATYIILSRKYGNDEKTWAYVAIAAILGFWLA